MTTTVIINKDKNVRYNKQLFRKISWHKREQCICQRLKKFTATRYFYIGDVRAQEEAGSHSGAKGKDSHEFGLPKRFLKLPVVVAEYALQAGVQ